MAVSSTAVLNIVGYTIDLARPVGSGAVGVVHIANHPTKSKVAAKRILLGPKLSKITKEFDKLLQLDHNNVVKFYDVHQNGSSFWIFMEYCAHFDLQQFFNGKELSNWQKVNIMNQIAQGVEYLHEKNIIHRDVKPGNILISSHSPVIAKLTDFDFCKFFEEFYDTSVMSTNVGTPAFKAPELFKRNAEGKLQYHRNVDIYSLGLTFLSIIQSDEKLKPPRIETPNIESELFEPIGRLIAERLKNGKKPLEVLLDDQNVDSSLNSSSGNEVTNRETNGTHRIALTLNAMKEIRKLIQKMTHHIPEERPSACDVVTELSTIEESLQDLTDCAPEESLSADEDQFQFPHHVDQQLISTLDTGLQSWGRTRFTVMESGVVVAWGKTSEQTPAAFLIYQNTSAGFIKIREVKGLCEHEIVLLLSVKLHDKTFLAVSCGYCQKIRLLDLDTEEVVVAFYHPKHRPSVMTNGEKGVMYVLHGGNELSLLELNSEKVPFNGKRRTIEFGMGWYHGFQYIPNPYNLLVLSWWKDSIIRAVSLETRQKVWEIKGKVDGKIFFPHGLLFSPQQVLLVADGTNCRVLVLRPRDGSHLQTIQFNQAMGTVYELGLHLEKLVMFHRVGFKEKVSYLTIH